MAGGGAGWQERGSQDTHTHTHLVGCSLREVELRVVECHARCRVRGDEERERRGEAAIGQSTGHLDGSDRSE